MLPLLGIIFRYIVEQNSAVHRYLATLNQS
jgi:hypothetical protein